MKLMTVNIADRICNHVQMNVVTIHMYCHQCLESIKPLLHKFLAKFISFLRGNLLIFMP